MIWRFKTSLFIFCASLVLISVSVSAENDWQQISEDTLMLQVPQDELKTGPREKRQILYPLLVSPLVKIRSTSDSLAGSACVTPKGQSGVCARLKYCLPMMSMFDLDDNGVYEGNVELAQMLTDISGSCHSGYYHNSASTLVNIPDSFASEDVAEVTEDLICCTGNVTKLTFPLISRPHIQNGVEAPAGQYPAIVAIMHGLTGGAKQFCGGSLLDNRNVLTAAHCIYSLDGSTVARMSVQIGDHNIYSTKDGHHETRKVSKLFYHKSFSSINLQNDVALLRLATPVEFTGRIKSIPLATVTPPAGTMLKVAGWGRLLDNGQFPTTLRHASVPLISNQDCRSKYSNKIFTGITVTESMLCTFSSNSADACQGDSGGPLIGPDGTQIGLVSWGLGCGSLPGVYTRVTSFAPWIMKNMKQP